MNPFARIVAVTALMFACSLLGAGNAAAHTALAGSDPADGATVDTVPAVVSLTFTEDINPAFATVVISSSDGRKWTDEATQVTGPQLRVPVNSGAPKVGDYTVSYRVVSADGHPVSGSFGFKVAAAPGLIEPSHSSPAAAPSTTAASPTAAPSESGPLGSDTRTSVLTAGAAGLLLGGAITFWQSRRNKRKNAS